MSFSHTIKSQLAKLLATEDLVVEHKKVETACFNVHTRVLTLPMWEKASNMVYDLLVGHEVGHALYTPDEDWSKNKKIPPQFVNVVEDARIEKLMKRRYAGLGKTFYGGYKELSDEDFFKLEGENIETMNLADRINLYFKIGNFIDIKFNAVEKEIVRMVNECETFDDVLLASEVLFNYCKQEANIDSDDVKTDTHQSESPVQSGSSEGVSSDNIDEDGETEESDIKQDNPQSQVKDDGKNEEEGGEDKMEIKTADSLENSLKELIDHMLSDNVYVEIPKVDLNKVIVENSAIHEKCSQNWTEFSPEAYGLVDEKFKSLKKNSQKEVNYLVKEFECRKSADAYARSNTARTGVLDCSKLHTYKYNEDLFKKVTTFPDGKNHGLIFILDWSGSMQYTMEDTLKQLYNLMWFCKKVNIPFEVYAFTNEYPNYVDGEKTVCYEKKTGVLSVGEWFSLMNIFTSKVNSKTLDEQMLNIYRVVHSFVSYCTYRIPMELHLSGTPLNESLVCLHQIIPQFKQENKLQKVQCIILTDGEACPLKYHREVQRPWEEEPYVGLGQLRPDTSFLRDRKTGNTYSFGEYYWNFTSVLLKNLRDNFVDVNFIGIRLLNSGSDAGSFIRHFTFGEEKKRELALQRWKKDKTFTLDDTGYHTYFGMSTSSLSNDASFEVDEGATKSKIKSAFVKSLKTKKMNKKVLSEFMDLIA
tara:strand:+ start:173 stop:2272 length:2100 start_codon:yes stop_codon:yes gene_type:complete